MLNVPIWVIFQNLVTYNHHACIVVAMLNQKNKQNYQVLIVRIKVLKKTWIMAQ